MGSSEKKVFKRGEVRSEILGEIRRQLEEGGRSWSGRKAAANVGCSTGSPYRHFANREEAERLLIEEGFAELHEAAGKGRNAYLAWAKANPELYALMFGPRSPGPRGDLMDGTLTKMIPEAHGYAMLSIWGIRAPKKLPEAANG